MQNIRTLDNEALQNCHNYENTVSLGRHRVASDLCSEDIAIRPPVAGRQVVVPAGRRGQILRRADGTNDSRPSGLPGAQVFSSFVVPLASGMTNSERSEESHAETLRCTQGDNSSVPISCRLV